MVHIIRIWVLKIAVIISSLFNRFVIQDIFRTNQVCGVIWKWLIFQKLVKFGVGHFWKLVWDLVIWTRFGFWRFTALQFFFVKHLNKYFWRFLSRTFHFEVLLIYEYTEYRSYFGLKQTKFNMLYYTDRGWDIAWCKTNGPLQMDLFLQFPTLQNLNIDLKSDQRSILELRIQIVRQKIH